MMGQIYAGRRQWPNAAAEFRRVLAMDSSKADVRGLLADALMAQQLYTEAIPQYQQYLEHHRNETGPLSSLGIALAATGRPDEAVEAFRGVVAVDPGNGLVHANLANALLAKGEFVEAARQATQATELLPGNSMAHEVLGLALAAEGKLEEATAQLERALQIDPGNLDARENLRDILRRRNASPLPR
jgi:tetratricopeptide (TPR) repeat protein